MVARIWRGTTAADRAQEYLGILRATGLADYAATPGYRGVQLIDREPTVEHHEVVTLDGS